MSKVFERERVQDELIFNVTEDLLIAMEDAEVTKAELARRLNKSKSRVSQMLSGDANITLRTLASMCFELGVDVDFRIGNEFSVRDPRSDPKREEHHSGLYFKNQADVDGWPLVMGHEFHSNSQHIAFGNQCHRASNDLYYWNNEENGFAEVQ